MLPDAARDLLVIAERPDASESRALSRRVERGTHLRLRRGVLVDCSVWWRLSKEERLLLRVVALAATARTRPVFSHWSAAVLLGLPVARRSADLVDLVVEGTRNRTVAGARVHRLHLEASEVTEVFGLLCTSPGRTAIDIAADGAFEEAVVLADAALPRLGPDGGHLLGDALELSGRRRGAERASRVLAFADGRSGSPGESISRVRLHRLRFVRPDLQVAIETDGLVDLADFGWEEVLGAGEFDGTGWSGTAGDAPPRTSSSTRRTARTASAADGRGSPRGTGRSSWAGGSRRSSAGPGSRRRTTAEPSACDQDECLRCSTLTRPNSTHSRIRDRARRGDAPPTPRAPMLRRMTAVVTPPRGRLLDRRVVAWAAWDWGSASFNAVVTTFVFTVYLTSSYFVDPALREGTAAHTRAEAGLTSGLSLGIALAGIAVALLAPALGRLADAAGARRRWLGITTAVVVASMLAMFFVVGAPQYFLLGVVLVAVGTVFFEVASVNYNAMLPRVAPAEARGRVSAVGWASGYFGGIVLLLLVYTTLIAGDHHLFGITEDGGLNIRVVAVCCAVWMAVFAVPVLLAVPEIEPVTERRVGLAGAYRDVFRLIGSLWRTRRNVLGFLIASAVFRDGLTGVFTFGGIIAAQVFGFSSGEVIVFAIAANVVAGISTFLSGRLDDRWGSKRVIVVSLVGLVVAGGVVFLLRDGGQTVFWIAGLALCLFVGPAQSASRSLMSTYTTPETEGELFGLYQTTGRAASFIAPAVFGLFAAVFGATAFGMLGIVLVLLVGLLLLLPVRTAERRPSPAEGAGRALEGPDHP